MAPVSSLLTSISTGAPSACARALGLNEATKGTAVAIAPTPPVTTVATVKKCRRVNPVLSAIEHSSTHGAKHQVPPKCDQNVQKSARVVVGFSQGCEGCSRCPAVRRADGTFEAPHYTQRPNGLATERRAASC